MEKLPSYYYRIDNPELLVKIDAFFKQVHDFNERMKILCKMYGVENYRSFNSILGGKEKHWDMRGCQLCKSDYIDLYKAMIEAQEQNHD